MGLLKPCFESSALAEKENFREALGAWFSKNGKDYPWRRTHDPYAVLVSEVMLQQTRIATVLGKGYYTDFLRKFPDVETLAKSGDEELLKTWEGLGYYRRARMLRETARAVLEKYNGVFPNQEAALLDLPGIGPYTAAALLSFAFDRPSALVDGNVSRVFSRLMDSEVPIDSTPGVKQHRKWAGELCDPLQPARHNHAMMELGQSICQKGVPACESCPVARFCKTEAPENLPVKKARTKITEISENAIWCRDDNGRILLHLEAGSRRTGLWKLPLRQAEELHPDSLLFKQTYHITRYKVSLGVHSLDFISREKTQQGDEWIEPSRLSSLPMATPFRKALDRLLVDF